jgi:hypothetical protein
LAVSLWCQNGCFADVGSTVVMAWWRWPLGPQTTVVVCFSQDIASEGCAPRESRRPSRLTVRSKRCQDSKGRDGMGAPFLGSGGARRRRRLLLAAEAFAVAAPVSREPASRARSVGSETPERTRVVTRLNTLIRPQPWANWLVIALGVGLWGATIFVGWSVDHSDSGLKQVLGLQSGRLAGLFGAACLLGATQLSLVTLWYRTRSRKDFQGRYRIWIWSSLIRATLFSAAISGWHFSGSAWLVQHLPGRLRPAAASAWLLGAMILVATATRLLSREMARARSTIWLLRSAQLVAAAALVLHFEPSLAPSGLALELQSGLASLWPLLMASALLHNARYVIHVSNEVMPSSRRPSRLSPIVQQVWAEVLSMGPSRATIASSLSPQNVWSLAVRIGKAFGPIVRAVTRVVARKPNGGSGQKRAESQAADRRKNASLPTVASPADSAAKTAHKWASKSVKSA